MCYVYTVNSNSTLYSNTWLEPKVVALSGLHLHTYSYSYCAAYLLAYHGFAGGTVCIGPY